MPAKAAKTVDEYISQYPPEVRDRLAAMRRAVHKAGPGIHESISYNLPTFTLGKRRVHFGAFAQHVGFYPGVEPLAELKAQLASYPSAKGSVQFPFDRPLPLALVTRLAKRRLLADA